MKVSLRAGSIRTAGTAEMNVSEAVERACEEPTLIDALSWICVWESERVIKQAEQNECWETLFKHCIQLVMEKYEPILP